MKTYIYTLENPKTGQIRYVGKTVQELLKRRKAHIYEATHRNNHKCNWIKKLERLGLEPKITLVETLSPGADWEFWESYWIEQFEQWGFNLVNHTPGGQGYLHSEETRKKISEANSGESHYQYGVPRTEEVKHKISNTLRGNQHAKGFKHTEETRKKVSERTREYYLNNPRDKSHNAKIGLGNRKKAKAVNQYSLEGEFIKRHESILSVVEKFNYDRSTIYRCVSGKATKACGFIWKWA